VDAGGFSAAAAVLTVAPSAPIRAVAALEQRLNVPLFRRTTRRVTITDEGAAYALRCRVILADLLEADRQISETSAELSGLIRVTAPVMLGRLHIAPLLARFLNTHPKLTIDFQLNDRLLDLVSQSFDLGIRIGKLSNSSMISQQVAQVQRVVCASPKYWKAHGKPTNPVDLLNHRCVHFDGFAPHCEWEFDVDGKKCMLALVSL
jgi:DNA-binding transcriptional LysR family regulator